MDQREIVKQLEMDLAVGAENVKKFNDLDGYYIIWTATHFVESVNTIKDFFSRLAKNDPKFKGFVCAPGEKQKGVFETYPTINALDFLRRRRRGEKLGLVHFFTSRVEMLFYEGLSEHMFSFLTALHARDLAHTYVPMAEERRFVEENAERYAQVILDNDDPISSSMLMSRLRMIASLDNHHTLTNRTDIQYEYFNRVSPDLSFTLKDKEVFVDVGASWGDIPVRFAEYVKDIKGSYIHAFEPNSLEFDTLRGLQLTLPMKAHNAIVSDYTGEMRFLTDTDNVAGSRIDRSNTVGDIRPVVRLDDTCEGATLIKVDAEGAEPEILRGAETLLSNPDCRLASCIYHYPADLFKTIEIMKGFGRNRFSFRQHTATLYDAIVYYH